MKQKNSKSTLGYPEVPSVAFSLLGPIEVRQGKLRNLHGFTEFLPRTITLHADQHPAMLWSTYWHEVVHLALFDAGVKLDEELEERVCDALGTYLAAAVRSGFLEVKAVDS